MEEALAFVINCDCGFVVTADGEEELIAKANEHIEAEHPEMVETISDEELLAMAEET
jgi:predicted small metal-binding protein